MPLLSKLKPFLNGLSSLQKSAFLRQMSEHRIFPMEPSRWQWTKFKDLTHFYIMLGLIPCGAFVSYMNLFQGPATLSEIPEEYTPKYYEYIKSPVTRFLAKYVFTNPQQDYEKFLSYLFIEHEKSRIRELESKILAKMSEDNDYQAYYFRPVATKYYRISKEGYDMIKDLQDPVPKEY
ncbi:NADH dehydrogenase [ubiquinone] 1 beta subcomplex subunit 5, mitochondrial [Anthonomus grandis grandis]|uniref:NADH dehydrogenase [ubiquinone] 1 beta subcomplex subunit 5, mitochondrial n=1 Tax=Anthonomus grandis grandis TaxID=2921223 RepID=UPI002165779B|nr:NADH dehydrogenase [ubiquinone] 1 beta subcomplex subunit 5, mitochondrial [Anthonomus grandis grandis]